MRNFDILIIGSGIAGLTFAYKMAPFAKIGIITKKSAEDSNTNYAQGGIASVFGKDDSFEEHIKDTMETGHGLCHPDAVRIMVENGPRLVLELKEMGARFETDESGGFRLGMEGGHMKRRIVHAGDFTGYEIEKCLLNHISSYNSVEILTNHFACDLIVDDENVCQGLYVLDKETNEIEPYFSHFVFIATGGIGYIYKHTTNPSIATGDGIAMSYIANAQISNMEFVQFHPTSLYGSDEKGMAFPISEAVMEDVVSFDFHAVGHSQAFLISEAVRGEGGFLKLKNNKQFMHKYHHLKSLAPRDFVARAIDTELKLSGEEFVYLDVSSFSHKYFQERFPSIYSKCREMGIDVPFSPIPVVPAAHYSCGGVLTDINARTSIKNLYAAGEISCTGVHGANRLASNSLLEAIVFAERAFLDIKPHLKEEFVTNVPGFYNQPVYMDKNVFEEIIQEKTKLKEIMWKRVAIMRSLKSLKEADVSIDAIFRKFSSMEKYNNVDYFELRNMLITSKIIIASALKRKESRGLHYLTDFPNENNEQYMHDTLIQKEV
ncbi:TPA: L-aspartate oxidase [candidate division WOR-3 bacterium]|jgi:L-aspartate oxidase|uniref:L-aspartate oxidase n=1 Tax=candidate division WOR-3 bacterium TaxID=2052148 RepID=A0A350HC29_UNCW3|nr:L-aspartate oxidase [candidate division WOR-3 bacterium]